jgi:ankyrin repeat protein
MALTFQSSSTDQNLLRSCSGGQLQDAIAALKAGADPNTRDIHDRTPLHFAVRGGHVGLIALLAGAGAMVDDFIRYDPDPENTPMSSSGPDSSPRLPVVNWKVGWGEEGHGCTPLMTAARLNRAEAIDALLAAGSDPNLVIRRMGLSAGPALCLAARHGSLDAIRRLAAGGADLNARCEREWGYAMGMTPLAVAARSEQAAAASLLVELGADTTDLQALELQAAVMTLDIEYTRTLLGDGRDPIGQTSDGMSAAVMALLSRDLDMARCFEGVGRVLNRSQVYQLVSTFDEDYALAILPVHMIREAPKSQWSEWRSRAGDSNKKRLVALLKKLQAEPT